MRMTCLLRQSSIRRAVETVVTAAVVLSRAPYGLSTTGTMATIRQAHALHLLIISHEHTIPQKSPAPGQTIPIRLPQLTTQEADLFLRGPEAKARVHPERKPTGRES